MTSPSSDPPPPIQTVTYQLTPDEMYSVMEARFFPRRRLIRSTVLLLLAACLGLSAGLFGHAPIGWLIAVAAVAMLALILLSRWLFIRRLGKALANRPGGWFETTFSPAGFVVVSPVETYDVPWNDCTIREEVPSHFLLRLQKSGPYFLLPKSAFTAEQLKAFREYAGILPALSTGPGVLKPTYAGFSPRLGAALIDNVIVAWIALPILVVCALVKPDRFVVSTPLSLLSTEHTVETLTSPRKNSDGSVTQVEERIITSTVLGRWQYLYRETIEHNGTNTTARTRKLIDPTTRLEIDRIGAGDIEIWGLLIYWVILESTPLQGSIGKRIVRIRVVNAAGGPPGFIRALVRNLAKFFSLLLCGIGWIMIAWTSRKQGLHDKLAGCYVIPGPQPAPSPIGAMPVQPIPGQ